MAVKFMQIYYNSADIEDEIFFLTAPNIGPIGRVLHKYTL